MDRHRNLPVRQHTTTFFSPRLTNEIASKKSCWADPKGQRAAQPVTLSNFACEHPQTEAQHVGHGP